MRYHYEKPDMYFSMYGTTYVCDHPVYDRCTLYESGGKGLAIIQQRCNGDNKTTWWDEIDPWLTDDIYLNSNFRDYFNSRAGEPVDGLYPTVSVRQAMWALKMKPIPRERWETCFDRRLI